MQIGTTDGVITKEKWTMAKKRASDGVYKTIAAWLDTVPVGTALIKADAIEAASHVSAGKHEFQVECALERERDDQNRVIFAYTTRHKLIPLDIWLRYGGSRFNWKRGNYLRTNDDNPYCNWWAVPGLLAARDASARQDAESLSDIG